VGSHFWNVQEREVEVMGLESLSADLSSEEDFIDKEEIDCLVFLRAGIDENGRERFLPRSLFIDEEPHFGFLLRDPVSSMDISETMWHGEVETFGQVSPSGLNEFQKWLRSDRKQAETFASFPFQDFVHSWSDYVTFDPHPQSLISVPSVQSSGASWQPSESLGELVEDGVRWLLEEADWAGSFSLIFDVSKAGSNIPKSFSLLTDELHDQSPKKAQLLVPCLDLKPQSPLLVQAILFLQALELAPHPASVSTPCLIPPSSIQNEAYDRQLSSTTAALALELLASPLKSSQHRTSLADLRQTLFPNVSRRAFHLAVAILPKEAEASFFSKSLEEGAASLFLAPLLRPFDPVVWNVERHQLALQRVPVSSHPPLIDTISRPIHLPLSFPPPVSNPEATSISVLSTVVEENGREEEEETKGREGIDSWNTTMHSLLAPLLNSSSSFALSSGRYRPSRSELSVLEMEEDDVLEFKEKAEEFMHAHTL
jgi:hypothetical protein